MITAAAAFGPGLQDAPRKGARAAQRLARSCGAAVSPQANEAGSQPYKTRRHAHRPACHLPVGRAIATATGSLLFASHPPPLLAQVGMNITIPGSAAWK